MFEWRNDLDREKKKILIMAIFAMGVSGYMTAVVFDLFPSQQSETSPNPIINESSTGSNFSETIGGEVQNSEAIITTGENTTGKQLLQTGIIRLAIPEFFDTKTLLDLSGQFLSQGITLEIISYDLQQSQTFSGIDLILTRYQNFLANSGNTLSLQFTEDPQGFTVSSLFIPFVREIVDQSMMHFMPRAIDPLITVFQENFDPQFPILSRENLYTHALQIAKKNRLQQALVFGIDSSTIRLLHSGKQPYNDYLTILYHLIKQYTSSGQADALSNIVDINTNQLIWSYPQFKKTLQTISKRAPNCELFADLCMISYGLGNIGILSLSAGDQQTFYFTGATKTFDSLRIYPFPSSSQTLPVSVWGWKASDLNPEKRLLIEKTLLILLQKGTEKGTLISKYLLPVFNSVYYQTLEQPLFSRIKGLQDNFELITQDSTLLNQWIQDSSILSLFEKRFTPVQYIEAPGWTY